MKRLTRDQVAARKEKAVRFTEDVLDDSDRAEEIAEESVDDYAARKGIDIVSNPRAGKRRVMARAKTRAELEQEIEDLQQENEELQEQLERVAEIVAPAEEDEEDEDDEEEEED